MDDNNTLLTVLTITAVALLFFQILLAATAVIAILRIKKVITNIQATTESAAELVSKLEGYFIGGRIMRRLRKVLRK